MRTIVFLIGLIAGILLIYFFSGEIHIFGPFVGVLVAIFILEDIGFFKKKDR